MTPPPRQLDYGTQVSGVRRRWLVAIIAAVLFAVVGAIVGRAISGWFVVYSCTSMIHWDRSSRATQTSSQQVATQIQSPAFIAAQLNGPGLPAVSLTPAEVAAQLYVRVIPNTDLVMIEYSDRDPNRAVAVNTALVSGAMRANPNGTLLEPPHTAFPFRRAPTAFIGLLIGAIAGFGFPWLWARRRSLNR